MSCAAPGASEKRRTFKMDWKEIFHHIMEVFPHEHLKLYEKMRQVVDMSSWTKKRGLMTVHDRLDLNIPSTPLWVSC
jgi:hypothetical protein